MGGPLGASRRTISRLSLEPSETVFANLERTTKALSLLLAFDNFRKMGVLVLLNQRADPVHECCQGMRFICADLLD